MKTIYDCPRCHGEWCEESQRPDHGDCPTYYDGCHCCELCCGYGPCTHGKWETEECVECDNEIKEMLGDVTGHV